eukprot:CAMPEP_0175926408 /NCGR_PEP_ID=MMETSP0108-20121206/16170_1 /TAXON_ID=195067 ORGANISM="Goniomonas pacifica, Strain CCMP1869" /NCGR_SAMPLE_ID=MMETSP0108 /ASSEMBLY_ACC=CAM_ASM_000204 /LENGTH=103 /DNA_ID=CAMNT_0017249637 /DNA_START=45 /DNA_END=356 /DNA_ORIENTATION=-
MAALEVEWHEGDRQVALDALRRAPMADELEPGLVVDAVVGGGRGRVVGEEPRIRQRVDVHLNLLDETGVEVENNAELDRSRGAVGLDGDEGLGPLGVRRVRVG